MTKLEEKLKANDRRNFSTPGGRNMDLQSKLRELETSTWDHPGEIGSALIAALRKAIEQRDSWRDEANYSGVLEEEDDAELLAILENGEPK
jgi:hypothetical protein